MRQGDSAAVDLDVIKTRLVYLLCKSKEQSSL